MIRHSYCRLTPYLSRVGFTSMVAACSLLFFSPHSALGWAAGSDTSPPLPFSVPDEESMPPSPAPKTTPSPLLVVPPLMPATISPLSSKAIPNPALRPLTTAVAPKKHEAAASYNSAKSTVVGFQDTRGNTIFLHDFKGKAVILNLWAKWCAPCLQEMKSLSQLQHDMKSENLAVIAISEDDAVTEVTDYYARNPTLTLTPFWDKNHAVFLALQTRGLPTTILVDKSGKSHERIEGPVNWQSPESRAMIKKLLMLR